jgi:beta-glucosidase
MRRPGSDEAGAVLEYFADTELSGEVQHTDTIDAMESSWFGDFLADMDARQFSVWLPADLVVPESGRYFLGLSCVGQGRLWVDGELLIDTRDKDPLDYAERQVEVE